MFERIHLGLSRRSLRFCPYFFFLVHFSERMNPNILSWAYVFLFLSSPLHSWSPHGRLFKSIFFSSIISCGSFYCWHLFADFALLGGGIFLSSSRAAPAPPSPGLWPPQTFPDASCVAVRHPSFQTEKFQTENNIFPQIHYVLFCISLDEAVHLFGIDNA